MMRELGNRMAMSGVLVPALLVTGALLQGDLVDSAGPAAIATVSLAFLAAATYPRPRPRKAAWLPAALLGLAAILAAVVSAVTCLSLARYAGRTDFNGFVIVASFLAEASLVKNLLLAMEETETLRASKVPA